VSDQSYTPAILSPVPSDYYARWVPEPIWMRDPTGRIFDCQVSNLCCQGHRHSQLLYPLIYLTSSSH